MNNEYISAKEARKILGVATATLINWDNQGKVITSRTPQGRRIYDKKDILRIATGNQIVVKKQTICYARVSSKKQMDDLERQKDFFKSRYPDCILVTDVGSGINWKRKGIKTILEQSMSGTVKEIVVAHRDRLCRFAFELFELIFKMYSVELVVLDNEAGKSKDTELADDILSIIHVYSCRKMGQGRYCNQVKENKNLPDTQTEEGSERMDDNEQICL